MTKLMLYGKVIIFIIATTTIGVLMFQNYNLQNRMNSAMVEIGNLSGALETQSDTIDQLNRQNTIIRENLQRLQEQTTVIENNTITELRRNQIIINDIYSEESSVSSELSTNRLNEIFRNIQGE
jgi:hypothetical protein